MSRMTVEPSPESRRALVRVSDVDRTRVLTELQQAGLEGRLTGEELEHRIAAVHASRTFADLDALVVDLPGDSRPEELVLRSGTGSIKRVGQWSVPRRIRVVTGTGSVRLDFTRADMRHDEVEIDLEVGTGGVRVIVPDGSSADVDQVSTGTGSVGSKVPQLRGGGGPHFRLRGHIGTGSAKVRYRRRWFRRRR